MNKEYTENQKKQRKSFKEYRKQMLKLLGSTIVGIVTAFAFPGRPIYEFLQKFFTDYIAGSITIWTQLIIMGVCGIKAVYHTFKAASEKQNIDNLQDEEENIVDYLVNENDKLNQKINSLEKEKTIVKEIEKTSSKAVSNLRKVNANEEENVKVKKYTK